ncbi:hypothetical protein DIPPA_02399 [Diplonema papillatum]|nr:hypothetical protein DIPPA_02399 [Diplonema papillatum]
MMPRQTPQKATPDWSVNTMLLKPVNPPWTEEHESVVRRAAGQQTLKLDVNPWIARVDLQTSDTDVFFAFAAALKQSELFEPLLINSELALTKEFVRLVPLPKKNMAHFVKWLEKLAIETTEEQS